MSKRTLHIGIIVASSALAAGTALAWGAGTPPNCWEQFGWFPGIWYCPWW